MRSVFVSVVMSLALVACGGGGDGDSPDAAPAGPDAAPPVTASGALSQACPGGDPNACTMGASACLVPQGSTNGICSVQCNGTDDTTTCAAAYTGPGLPACLLSVPGPNPGDPAQPFCAIVCQAPPEANCTACNGMCPTGMACGTPMNGVAICEAI